MTSPLEFPTEYPIKVVGPPDAGFRAQIDAIVRRHAPDITSGQISQRASSAGRFVSISYTLQARSREQVVALVTELQATPGVLMVI